MISLSARFDLKGIGARLREERARLNVSQEECGKMGGVSRVTQQRYETSGKLPALDYLNQLRGQGFDIGFILIGSRVRTSADVLSDPLLLSDVFRSIEELAQKHNYVPSPEAKARAFQRYVHALNEEHTDTFRPTLEEAFFDSSPVRK